MNFSHRLDFGFWNPNAAGAFFAVLIFAAFLFSPKNPKLRIAQVSLAGLLFLCVLLTASRAALAGIAIGGLTSWLYAGMPKPSGIGFQPMIQKNPSRIFLPTRKFFIPQLIQQISRNGLIAITAFLLLSAFLGSKAFQRIGTLSPEEPSTASRLEIYSTIPALMVSAPLGWGKGNAAPAYENWFQDRQDMTRFKNLLSTHGTWFVEFGIPFAAASIVVWCLAFWVSTPMAGGGLACWAVCSALSHVGVFWWMWLVPFLLVVVSVWQRWRERRLPSFKFLMFLILLACFGTTLLSTFALLRVPPHPLAFSDRILRYGKEPSNLCFLAPDPSVLGKAYGKSLRHFESFSVAETWEKIPNQATVILSGKGPAEPPPEIFFQKIVWLNPPQEIPASLRKLLERTPEKVVFNGSFRQDSSPPPWKSWFEGLEGAQWRHLQGRGKFLGSHLEILSNSSQYNR